MSEKIHDGQQRDVRSKSRIMEDKLMVSIGKDVVPIEIDSIIYVESRNRKVAIHTAKEEIEYYDKIEDLEQMLGDGFFRVHRGFLVNYNCEITLMCKDTSKCIISTVGKIVDIINIIEYIIQPLVYPRKEN